MHMYLIICHSSILAWIGILNDVTINFTVQISLQDLDLTSFGHMPNSAIADLLLLLPSLFLRNLCCLPRSRWNDTHVHELE